jgi:3-hydroxybutyryl-CoA dehydrogenase
MTVIGSEIRKVGIVGAGTMGRRIAGQCLLCGKVVYLYDISPEALEQAVDQIRASTAGQVDGAAMDETLARLHACHSLEECVTDVDLVLENVPENLTLKRRVFADIDRLAPARTLIGTNSSSIPPSRIASATRRPDRFYNANFSPPAVEVMGHPGTSEHTLRTVEAFLTSIEMVPLRVKREIMGYALNRTWRAVKREALHLAADGYVNFEDLDRGWMLNFGSPWGPFGLMDIVGLDVVLDIELQYYENSREHRDRPPAFLEAWVAQGRLGVKSGQGFYTYPGPEYEWPGWLRKEPPWTPDQALSLDGDTQ